jgi:ferritin-like metal-binding protein YciE
MSLLKDITVTNDLFVRTLQEIYYAEKTILKLYPIVIERTTATELRLVLFQHCGETENHIVKLEQLIHKLHLAPRPVACAAIDGIVREIENILDQTTDGRALDLAIAAAAQDVEGFETMHYKSLINQANGLGLGEIADLLGQTLKEEMAVGQALSSLTKTESKAACGNGSSLSTIRQRQGRHHRA